MEKVVPSSFEPGTISGKEYADIGKLRIVSGPASLSRQAACLLLGRSLLCGCRYWLYDQRHRQKRDLSIYRSVCRWCRLSICYSLCSTQTAESWASKFKSYRNSLNSQGKASTWSQRLFWKEEATLICQYPSVASSPMLTDLPDDDISGFTASEDTLFFNLALPCHLLMSALVVDRLLQGSRVLVWCPWRGCAVPIP